LSHKQLSVVVLGLERYKIGQPSRTGSLRAVAVGCTSCH